MMEIWRSVIPNGKTLKKKFVVCHVHFDENDLLMEDVLKLSDGTEFRSKRIRPHLKENAIPKHFPLTDTSVETKNFVPPPAVSATVDKTFGDEKDFSEIYKQAKDIPLPSSYWFVTQMKDYLLFNKWFENLCGSSLRILLDTNNQLQVIT